MKQFARGFCILSAALLTGFARSVSADPPPAQELLNVSYDPTRELYEEMNRAFVAEYRSKTGGTLTIRQSHGGSGKQARSVIDGLEADVVTLALSLDIDAIAHAKGSTGKGLLSGEWRERLPNHSVPFESTVVFVVRKGNPRAIKDWDDLTQDGLEVITPNPKTSGGARLNYLAAWEFADRRNGGDRGKILQFMRALFHNVPVLDTGARASTTTFVAREIGDVQLAWENEALLTVAKYPDALEVVYPRLSIRAEIPVAVVDSVVDKKHTRDVAEAYLAFLFSEPGQVIAMKHHYRPTLPAIHQKAGELFKPIELFSLESEFGGWPQIQEAHFKDGGMFDQISVP